jgi:outer membrane lipoprotein-sorting protein
MRFIEPPEIKGTSMLTFDYNEGDDDMWIYMPALRKTRRIVSNEKSKSFMGSEFSNADMVIPNLNDFNYQMISKNELIEDVECWNIIMKPKNEEIANNYGYSKRKVWIGKKDFVIRKGEIYDLSDELLKTMNVKKVELIDPKNKKYQNTIMEIYNEQNGRSSIFEIEKIIYNPNVKDIYFTTKYLEN